jgi:two-component system chemotaxis response regulator CheB
MENIKFRNHEVIVIGVSAGGFHALSKLLGSLKAGFDLPIIIVQHEKREAGDFFSRYLDIHSSLRVKQADEKEKITDGTVYLASPGYHLLIEDDRTFSLSVDELVNYARPSIDVLFESAADVYGSKTIGIILTGANTDGALGLKKIKESGGYAIVQDPVSAEVAFMPQAALKETLVDQVLPLDRIGPFLNAMRESN